MTIEPTFEPASLLERIVQRDQAALAALYDRYAPMLYAIALRSLGSVEESEEVVLDVFSQVWQTADRYDVTKAQVDTWLSMITRSRVLDRIRKRQRITKVTTAFGNITQIQSNQSSVNPIEDVLRLERCEQVLAALAQLPTEQRQVLELAYYHGLTQTEIAAQLGISLGTVKTRVRLGLNKLRVALVTWKPS
jgi:RNA polymerase sigma-70 factor (ECF subfamily)